MKLVPLSPARRFLMWWFRPPLGSPFVTCSVTIDFSAAATYLARLNAAPGPRVTVQSLFMATVGRLYRELPVANRRITAGRVYQLPNVSIAAPVSLLGHAGAGGMEVTMVFVAAVDEMSLRKVAAVTTERAATERSGRSTSALLRALVAVATHAPAKVIEGALDAVNGLGRSPWLAETMWKLAPVSTGVTNPGAGLGKLEGMAFRAAAMTVPDRLVHVGTVWGVSAVQDEVVAIAGRPEVRPMLPVVFCFDHRLFDGVMASRILKRLGELLQDPEALFGPDGER
ncbi:MAG: 2-oxo acid dehydrogenase subunit E2 [Polyangiaceae bacterium]|nr:2-oxo acid dehydrogenase subunit E2 [Polyangiaceae bacterium]